MDIDFSFRPGEGLPGTALTRLREAGPVFWSETLNAWAVTSYASVQSVLTDLNSFTSTGTPVQETLGPEGMLLNDTGLHNKMRAVWTKALARGTIGGQYTALERLARVILEGAVERIVDGGSADMVPIIQTYALRFVSCIFDIPEDRLDVIRRWNELSSDAPVLELGDEDSAREKHRMAKQCVYDVVNEAVADRRLRLQAGERPHDLVALMAAAEGREGITAAMVSDNLFNLIIGTDTTERWIANMIVLLAQDANLRRELCRDPQHVEAALQEAMRTDTVAQVIMRRVKAEGVVLGGQRLARGDHVYVMLGAANRDPDAFQNADTFDSTRPAKQHMGFGFGFHHCLGINIARVEAIAFIRTLLDLLPDFRIVECDYGSTWALWGPRRLEIGV